MSKSIGLDEDTSVVSESILDSGIDVSAPCTPRPKEQVKLSNKIKHALEQDYPCYSFEYFPPKNKQGLFNLTERIRRMGRTQPLWVDITHSKNAKTLDLAQLLLEYTTVDIMVHLSMTNMSKEDFRNFLNSCKALGIRNILAIRGDPPRGYDSWVAMDDDLQHCADLVRFIRAEYGDYFSIFVGGYPEGHHNAECLDDDIKYLKEKVEAGADAIITQLFYDTSIFFAFIKKCRLCGIRVPIIPGLMPMQTYSSFVRIVSFTNIRVPGNVWTDIEPIKHNDEKVKQYGIQLMNKMCREIIDNGINTLHFYTFNLERSVTEITNKLNKYHAVTQSNHNGMKRSQSCSSLSRYSGIKKSNSCSNLQFVNTLSSDLSQPFPWDNSNCGYLRRKQESVRPIFWANRQESYLNRTAHWDEFPNGRWGDYRSPAYGEFLDHHFLRQNKLTVEYRLSIWRRGGELKDIADVCDVFVSYLDKKIDQLPWCNQEIGAETLTFLLEPLKLLNSNAFLTINSQPQVNGAPSSDAIVGWGKKENGYVYQKAYLEFFCSKSDTEKLLNQIESAAQNTLSYQAINMSGNWLTNVSSLNAVNAVTWGVFANCEILQPTIVDPQSFIAWKDEAFSLWTTMWQSIYGQNERSYELIQEIVDNWYLVNIVENDYINGDIFEPFREIFRNHKNYKHIENVFEASITSQSKMWSCSSRKKAVLHADEEKNEKNPYLDEKLLSHIAQKHTKLK